jgi:hypothetical protein
MQHESFSAQCPNSFDQRFWHNAKEATQCTSLRQIGSRRIFRQFEAYQTAVTVRSRLLLRFRGKAVPRPSLAPSTYPKTLDGSKVQRKPSFLLLAYPLYTPSKRWTLTMLN